MYSPALTRRRRTLIENNDNCCDDIIDRLMLPEAEHAPPVLYKYRIRPKISIPVASDLGIPPLGIGLRRTAMNRTPVPEAPVEKYRNPLSRPNYVSTEALVRQKSAVNSESESSGMKLSPDRQLDLCPACLLVPHLLTHTVSRRRQMVRHRFSPCSSHSKPAIPDSVGTLP